MDFATCMRDFNRGDLRQVVYTWYTPDARFRSGRYNARDREEIADRLRFLYDGVHATMRLQAGVRDGDRLFAEIDF